MFLTGVQPWIYMIIWGRLSLSQLLSFDSSNDMFDSDSYSLESSSGPSGFLTAINLDGGSDSNALESLDLSPDQNTISPWPMEQTSNNANSLIDDFSQFNLAQLSEDDVVGDVPSPWSSGIFNPTPRPTIFISCTLDDESGFHQHLCCDGPVVPLPTQGVPFSSIPHCFRSTRSF